METLVELKRGWRRFLAKFEPAKPALADGEQVLLTGHISVRCNPIKWALGEATLTNQRFIWIAAPSPEIIRPRSVQFDRSDVVTVSIHKRRHLQGLYLYSFQQVEVLTITGASFDFVGALRSADAGQWHAALSRWFVDSSAHPSP